MKDDDDDATMDATTTTTSDAVSATPPPLRKFREAVVKVLSTITAANARPLRSKFGTTATCESKNERRRKVFRVVFSRTFECALFAVVCAHFAVLAVLLAQSSD